MVIFLVVTEKKRAKDRQKFKLCKTGQSCQ